MDKEVVDALYVLLHCALKDKEYETQREQFEIVINELERLDRQVFHYQKEIKNLSNVLGIALSKMDELIVEKKDIAYPRYGFNVEIDVKSHSFIYKSVKKGE